ncbi:hypothetical protein BC940DRAFT_71668 [Gongronella butleri]|nr:hypothetical protein BC940DRAFT_71668 [Gongronella butleri]
MSSKRPAPEDEAETSQGAARRLKQRRMDYFYPSATASSLPTTGRTLAIEDDDPVRIPVEKKIRAPSKSTEELVRLLNDPKEKDYDENTVPYMRCGVKTGCKKIKSIDYFMKITTRGASVKKTFYKMCKDCREDGNEKNKLRNASDDVQRTREAIAQLNLGETISEKILRCTGCKQWKLVNPQLMGTTTKGVQMYYITCTDCRAYSTKFLAERREAVKAEMRASADDETALVKCGDCGFDWPRTSFVDATGKEYTICLSCREEDLKNREKKRLKREEIKARRPADAANDILECTVCFAERKREKFTDKNGKLLNMCDKCRYEDSKQVKDDKRICVDCRQLLPISEFDAVDDDFRGLCKVCLKKARERAQQAYDAGKTTTHSSAVIRDTSSTMRSKNIGISHLYKQNHPLATEDDVTRIAPLFSKPEFDALIMSVLRAAHDTCELCGATGLRMQHVKDLSSALERASMQRVDPKQGYTAQNINCYCLPCNKFIHDLSPKDAILLIDHIFSSKESEPRSDKLSSAETKAIYQLAHTKNVDVAMLVDVARAAQHTCAISKTKGNFCAAASPMETGHFSNAKFRLDSLSFDRIVPGCRGGLYEPTNIQVINIYLNLAKAAMSQEDFQTWWARMTSIGADKLKANLLAGVRRAQAIQGKLQ